MSENKKVIFTVLDGNAEEQKRIVNEFLGTLTDEADKESMSEKYDYLDED